MVALQLSGEQEGTGQTEADITEKETMKITVSVNILVVVNIFRLNGLTSSEGLKHAI